jgi:hypothetical protein
MLHALASGLDAAAHAGEGRQGRDERRLRQIARNITLVASMTEPPPICSDEVGARRAQRFRAGDHRLARAVRGDRIELARRIVRRARLRCARPARRS